MPRPGLTELERSDLDLPVALAWLVRDQLGIGEDELRAARRRAIFVLAAGGDPHRDLEPGSVAADRLAGELETPERRAALAGALERLEAEAAGLPRVEAALAGLRAEPERAWRSVALALLADELAGE